MNNKPQQAKTTKIADGPLLSDRKILPPKELFHYCKQEAFENILSNGCMWLSDAAHMNDKMEGKWMDHIIDNWRNEGELVQWKEAGHIYSDYQIFKSTFYINCFCEAGDLLSQWRASYGDDGKGCSIGFKMEPWFLKGNLTLSDVFRGAEGIGGHLEKVVYNEKDQKKILRRVFVYLDHWMNHSLEQGESIYLSEAFLDAGKDCLAYLTRLIKHPGFSEEREWRIIYNGIADLSNFGIDKKKQTRIRDDKKIQYHVWKFPPTWITKIYLGPKCAVTTEEVQKKLLDWNYVNVEVKKSELPYV